MDAAPVDEIRQFFERNATMPGIVSLPSGVQYRVVKPGNGRSPDLDDWVVVDYLGMTRDGSIFDNTYDSGQRAIFGMDGLLPGWQEPLLQMQEGAEFEVYVPPGIANIGGIPSLNKPDMEPGIYLIELIQVVEVGEGG
jgi:FKBP-type peptidyl-prolyl cis-trans isomerase